MKNPLNILFVEDVLEDAELVRYKLRNVATIKQCDLRAGFEQLLVEPWDVILIDFKLTDMSADDVIRISKKAQPDTPLILLTGSVGDIQASIVGIKYGIAHFLKDRIEGLPLAVQAAYEGRELRAQERELRAQAIRNDRLEILGHLSLGVSHDMNNVLQCVLAGTELLHQKINPMDARILDAMERAAKRGADMVSQILTFARGSNGGIFKPVSMEYLFGEVNQILKTGPFTNIRTTTRVSLGTSKVLCDATQLQQVLLNLAFNAKDAMKHGGELHLSAQNVSHVDGEQFAINGNFVCITVMDTGTGIPDEALPRIFDAFFTTKPVGKGTGMGLAIVKSIVDAHGGVIQVKSAKTGTTFNIYLPAAEKTDKPDTTEADKYNGNGATIILAEDEETLRLYMQLQLEAAGYRVLTAANGPEALAHFRVGNQIDLLLTDVDMPIMRGDEVAQNLRAMSVEVPVVFISGHDATTPHDPEPRAILQKPFSQHTLLSTLKGILNP